jgi:hypothetical protein
MSHTLPIDTFDSFLTPFFLEEAATTALAATLDFSSLAEGFVIRPPSPFFFDDTAGAACFDLVDVFPILSLLEKFLKSFFAEGNWSGEQLFRSGILKICAAKIFTHARLPNIALIKYSPKELQLGLNVRREISRKYYSLPKINTHVISRNVWT